MAYPWETLPIEEAPPGAESGIVYPWDVPGFVSPVAPALGEPPPQSTEELLRGIIGEQPVVGAPAPALDVDIGPAVIETGPTSLDEALQGQAPAVVPAPAAAQPTPQQEPADLATALQPPAALAVAPTLTPEQEVAALETLPLEEQAARRAAREQDLQQEFARRKSEGLRADREAADRNLASYETATARARADAQSLIAQAKELGQREVDPDRWWGSRSTGQKIAGFIGAAISGALAPGGQNQTLGLINQAIDRDLDAQVQSLAGQRAALATQQGLVGDLYRQTGDPLPPPPAAPAAMMQRLDDELGAEMAQYDPRSARVQAMADARAQARQEIAASEARIAEAQWKRYTEQAKIDEGQARIAQDERESRRQAYTTREGQRTQERIAAAQLAAAGKEKEAIRGEKEQERVEQRGVVGGLTGKGGGAFVAPTPEDARTIRSTKAAVDQSAALLDRMLLAREKYGWSSDLVKSPEWRAMKGDFAQLLLNKKELDKLGVLAGPDMGLMEAALGTDDPTEIRDPTPGLKNARRNIVEKFTLELKNYPTYSGEDYVPAAAVDVATERSEQARTAEDRAALDLYGTDVEGLDLAIKKRQDEARAADRPVPSDEVAAAAIRAEHERLLESIEQEKRRQESLRFGGPRGNYPWETR